MAKIKGIEKRIWDIEGFDICILTSDGRDVRGDLSGVPQYYTYDWSVPSSLSGIQLPIRHKVRIGVISNEFLEGMVFFAA